MKNTKFLPLMKQVLLGTTVEPLLFFHAIAYGLAWISVPSLYFDKICRVGSPIFGNWNGTQKYKTWNDSICDTIDNGDYEDEQLYVQETYSKIQLVTMFIKGVPPIIFVLFIGPWSDNCGRKVLILLPMIGFILNYIWFCINTIYYEELTVEYLMFEAIANWFGGWTCFFLGLYSYISDVSSPKSRAVRIGTLDCTLSAAIAIALGISGKLTAAIGYPILFLLSAGAEGLAFVYGLLVLKESRMKQKDISNDGKEPHQNEKELSSLSDDSERHKEFSYLAKMYRTICEIFDSKNIIACYNVAFKEREGGIRHIIVIVIFLLGMNMLCGIGLGVVNYPYAREKFNWESTDYFVNWWSIYSSVKNILAVVSYLILPILTHVLFLEDATITIYCIISQILCIIATLMANKPEILYVAASLGILSIMTSTPMMAWLTKLVGKNDIGKVFACVSATTALVDFLAPLYSLLYEYTLEWYSGFCYCLTATLNIIMIILSLYCRWYSIRWSQNFKIDN